MTAEESAGRCYDCGKAHPEWFEAYLTALWEAPNGESDLDPALVERARKFSESEHGQCFL